MSIIAIAIISVTVIGIICAAILAVASKVMAVEVDEMFPAIRECLPGANCGACGFAGCDGYANALVSGETTKTNLCVPGADATSKMLSEIMGVEFEDVVEQVAVVQCCGEYTVTTDKYEYDGIRTCAAENLLYGGKGHCTFRCLGMGDCARVCPQNAICMDSGIAHVDHRKCIGCGLCAKQCPNHLISLVPDVVKVVVTCSNTEKGAVTRGKCSHGCIGCMKCVKNCEHDAIHVENFLARIDYDKCVGCGKCAEVCTTGCIELANFSGAHR